MPVTASQVVCGDKPYSLCGKLYPPFPCSGSEPRGCQSIVPWTRSSTCMPPNFPFGWRHSRFELVRRTRPVHCRNRSPSPYKYLLRNSSTLRLEYVLRRVALAWSLHFVNTSSTTTAIESTQASVTKHRFNSRTTNSFILSPERARKTGTTSLLLLSWSLREAAKQNILGSTT